MGSRLNTGVISRKQVSRQTTRDPMGEGRSGSREGSEPVPDVPGSQEEEAVEEGEAQLLHLGGCPGRVALEIGRSWRLGARVQILWGIRSLGLGAMRVLPADWRHLFQKCWREGAREDECERRLDGAQVKVFHTRQNCAGLD